MAGSPPSSIDRDGFSRPIDGEAAGENERSEIWITHEEQAVVCRQVVGFLARRVVCRVTPGVDIHQGDRLGIMKFGSAHGCLSARGISVTARSDGWRRREGRRNSARSFWHIPRGGVRDDHVIAGPRSSLWEAGGFVVTTVLSVFDPQPAKRPRRFSAACISC